MYGLLECVDGQRDLAELADGAVRAARAASSTRSTSRASPRSSPRRACSPAPRTTRRRAEPAAGAALEGARHQPARDAAADRAVHAPLPAVGPVAGRSPASSRSAGSSSSTRASPRRPAQAFRQPGAAAAGLRAGRRLGRLPRARPRGRLPLRRRDARRDGLGLYIVWPAFYTDVTDSYRLPRRDRLRVDLGGLYFNAIVAVVTHRRLAGLARRRAAAARRAPAAADGQAALAGDPRRRLPHPLRRDRRPDLYAHIGPTLRRLLPAVVTSRPRCGAARALLVTAWVLVVVPVLLSLSLGAVCCSRGCRDRVGQRPAHRVRLPHEGARTCSPASLVRLLALALPVARQRSSSRSGCSASTAPRRPQLERGQRPPALVVVGAGRRPSRRRWPGPGGPPASTSRCAADEGGTLGGSRDRAAARPGRAAPAPIPPRTRDAPRGRDDPARRRDEAAPGAVLRAGAHGEPAVAILSTGDRYAAAFPFALPSSPGPGDTQALAVGTKTAVSPTTSPTRSSPCTTGRR